MTNGVIAATAAGLKVQERQMDDRAVTDQATADQQPEKGRGKRKKPEQHAPVDAPVLTIPEASQIVRLSRASLYRAMDDKKLRYLKYGTRRLIAREDLDTFIASLRAP